MVIELGQLAPELRAVRDAELEVDRAEVAMLEALSPSRRAHRWAARSRYQAAQVALQTAIARRDRRRAELTGQRHLRIVAARYSVTPTNSTLAFSKRVPVT